LSGAGPGTGAPVHFDDALFAADLARLPETARAAVTAARNRYEREGVDAAERRRCDAEHPSGTRLAGCLKVYVPDFAGPWRIVFQIAWLDEDTLGLQYVATGVAHPPAGARRRSVYELAHYRLHGSWPHH
jgi:hypothetical protein